MMLIADPTAPPSVVPASKIPPGDAFMLDGDPYLALAREAFEGTVFLEPQRPGEPPDQVRAVPLDTVPAVDLSEGTWVTVNAETHVLHLRDAVFAPSMAAFWRTLAPRSPR